MYQDFKDLLSAFNARGVRYLVVGGYAVILHAQPRATKDIDLLVKADPFNAHLIYSALAEFGMPLNDVRPEDFAKPGTFFRFGFEPRAVDILLDIPGIDFEAAWSRRVESIVDPGTGLKAWFISAPDLMQSKQASGRLQDLADAEAIRAAIKNRSQEDVS